MDKLFLEYTPKYIFIHCILILLYEYAKKKNVPWKAHKAHLDNISEPGQAFWFLKLHISLPLPLKNHHQGKTQGSYSFLFFNFASYTAQTSLEATQEVEKLVLQTKAGKHELSGSTVK